MNNFQQVMDANANTRGNEMKAGLHHIELEHHLDGGRTVERFAFNHAKELAAHIQACPHCGAEPMGDKESAAGAAS
jgi:hypothetical protein